MTSSGGSAGPVILLVDDEPDVLEVLGQALDRAGYQVVRAGSAGEAMDTAAELTALDLLVTDIELGDGWGGRLALEVRRLKPAVVGVVYISGHAAEDPILKQGIEDHMLFLEKPFAPSELVDVVNGLLGRATGGEVGPEQRGSDRPRAPKLMGSEDTDAQ